MIRGMPVYDKRGRQLPPEAILAEVPEEEILKRAGQIASARRRTTAQNNPRKLRPCPHCGVEMGALELAVHKPRCPSKPAVEARSDRRGRPRKLQPCPHCGDKFGVVELAVHQPSCPKRREKSHSEPWAMHAR